MSFKWLLFYFPYSKCSITFDLLLCVYKNSYITWKHQRIEFISIYFNEISFHLFNWNDNLVQMKMFYFGVCFGLVLFIARIVGGQDQLEEVECDGNDGQGIRCTRYFCHSLKFHINFFCFIFRGSRRSGQMSTKWSLYEMWSELWCRLWNIKFSM